MSVAGIIGMFLLLTVVGAAIGSITNWLAIKMLFKPYHPVMIGKWRVPFTPGLIPKRHEEIALQLGKLVMKHLITADSLVKKMAEGEMRTRVIQIVRGKVSDWIDTEESVAKALPAGFDVNALTKSLEGKAEDWLQHTLDDLFEKYGDSALNEVIPESFTQAIEQQLPLIAKHMTESVTAYLQSPEGKNNVQEQLDHFFENKGMLGNMLGMFLGNQSLIDKLYPELIGFLNRPAFTLTLQNLLDREWQRMKEMTVDEAATSINLKAVSRQLITERIIPRLPIQPLFSQKPGDLLNEWREPLLDKAVPALVDQTLHLIGEKATDILQTLDLETMIADQVRDFSIKELEEVVLFISKREFKMITYLGGLLGGIIGIVQAVILLFVD